MSLDQRGTVILCGDSTNDAVALAQADIGIHTSSGSEMAKTAADVVSRTSISWRDSGAAGLVERGNASRRFEFRLVVCV